MKTDCRSTTPEAVTPQRTAIAILGAGTMGAYIAYLCARAEYDVRLHDLSASATTEAVNKVAEWAARDFGESPASQAACKHVQVAPSLEEAVVGVGIVIEALPEDLTLKQEIFARLDALCPPQVILASNSSSLRISRIETGVKLRGRVANLHFFQPPAKPVEIMGGSATAPSTLERLRGFVLTLGFLPFVLHRESTGFLYNRIWRALKKEVLREIAEGVASAEDIDRIVILMWGWTKGPFGWMDVIGLDVVRDIENVYSEESGRADDKPPAFLEDMIARGELGVKSGKGFYTYPNPAFEQPGWLHAEWENVAPASEGVTREAFVGAWRLLSFEATAGHRKTFPLGEDAEGCLLYTPTGRMSVVLSKAARPHLTSADMRLAPEKEKATSFDSCFSYFGTFELQDGAVIHHIEQCTFPNWIGSAQKRFFQLDGNRLTLRTPPTPLGGEAMASTLVWERINE